MKSFANVSIDNVRSYWNKRPCNIRHSQKPIGTKEYFDDVEKRKYFVEPHLPLFADFSSMKGKKVLEIGCGIGTTTTSFAKAGALVTAVDLSDESLSLAKKRIEVFGLSEQVQFFQANAEELSKTVPLDSYDLIFSFGVIHHTPHPERVLKELYRYLKPGGELKIMVYHKNSWKVWGILLGYGKGKFWKLQELIAKHSEAQTGCPVTYSYTASEISKLLKDHGFVPGKIEIDHIFPYRVKDYVEYRYVKNWYFRFMPKALFRFLETHFGWHLCATAKKP